MMTFGDEFEIFGRRILTPDGIRSDIVVEVRDGTIAHVGRARENSKIPRIDAGDLLVAPGLVDLHGDAFERQIMPRPGVRFPMPLALADTDRQLVANGITTAFHAVTYSWEPGLRGRESMLDLVETLARCQSNLACDTRLHLRFEVDNLDGLEDACGWLDDGSIHLLAFNDHTGHMRVKAEKDPEELLTYTQRTGLSVEEFRGLIERVWQRRPQVDEAILRLADAARLNEVPMLSHDDPSPEVRAQYYNVGAAISEFPKTEDTARTARQAGGHVVMGSPNVVRGGSHLTSVGAADMVGKKLCSVLASDYYYPAMLGAPFRLAVDGKCADLSEAWELVSANPAEAAGLHDRGRLQEGLRADILLIDDRDMAVPTLHATFGHGRLIYAREKSL